MFLELLSNLFGAVKTGLGLAQQRDAELNAPAVVANKEAADAQQGADQIAKDVAAKDTDAVRKDIA